MLRCIQGREGASRISQEEPTEVADMVPRNMAPPGGSFRWFRRWPMIVPASCVEVAVRFGLPGKASHSLRNIQHCFKELLRDAGIKYPGFTHRMDFLLVHPKNTERYANQEELRVRQADGVANDHLWKKPPHLNRRETLQKAARQGDGPWNERPSMPPTR